jgi:uncharacterized protein (UPF0261 family)
MADAAAAYVRRLHEEGRCDGILAAGGSGNTAIATRAMQALPVGVPKLMVSTMAAGDTRDYVGASDVTMMPSITDVAGVNSISGRILANAAAAIAGMVSVPPIELGEQRPLIGATMFGVTTAAVTAAREDLERRGYEVLVFHATGTGGKAMEALAADGFLEGVLDLTTTELCDDLVGGVLSAGPDRLEAAGRLGLPQVVSLGALDMVNFGARETVPEQFAERNLRAQPLRPQPIGDADADHARGVSRARSAGRAQALGGHRADGALRAAEGRIGHRRRRRPVPRR